MNNLGKKLSIVVPVYNTREYLTQCVDSIINQTYSNIEIIIVDDASTDDTGAICESYLKDKRVRVIHNSKNEGLVRSRKKGLDLATGEYVIL